jgi:hypothetical protein
MDCSTSLTHLPMFPQLPRGLVFLLILSLIFQLTLVTPSSPQLVLPALILIPGRTHFRKRYLLHCPRPRSVARWKHLLTNQLPRLLARCVWLAVLLQTSGWHSLALWANLVLLLPGVKILFLLIGHTQVASTPRAISNWQAHLQRTYQLVVGLLLVSSLFHCLGPLQPTLLRLVLPMALGVSATSRDDQAEIYIDRLTDNQWHIVLRGAFHFFWEPQDGFEEILLHLLLRRLQRCGETKPFFSQAQIARAFEVSPMTVSHWETLVKKYSWHVLSDRYRRAL